MKTVNFKIGIYKAINKLDESIVSLDKFFDNMAKTINESGVLSTTKEIRGTKIRFQEIQKSPNQNISMDTVHVIKTREDEAPPLKTNSDGDVSKVDLDDSEDLAEGLSLIYDREKHILVLKANRHSLSIGELEDFLNKCISNEKISISLRPIVDQQAVQRAKDAFVISKVESSFEVYDADENLSLHGLFKLGEDLNARVAKVTLSVGHYKTSMVKSEVLSTFDTNKVEFQALKMTIKDKQDSKSETINLLKSILTYSIKIETNRQNPLDHNRILALLEDYYLSKLRSKI